MGRVLMSAPSRALDAAGIHDPTLRASYQHCRRLHARFGRTYYLATSLLPPAKRPYVHALYGFARVADDIVDHLGPHPPSADRERRLAAWGARMLADMRTGHSQDSVGRAVVDTVHRWRIPVEYFEAFLASMAMDLTVTQYPTYDDLTRYMYGSAAVIGLQMVPVLGAVSPAAYPAAQDLGMAFQLVNFVRDVGEDLDRGRLYLPLEDLDRFGLSRADLQRKLTDERVRALLAFQIARVRRLSHRASPGITALEPASRPCVQTALTLYGGIADAVEAMHYQVFDRRAAVPLARRVSVAGPAWLRARSLVRAGAPPGP